MFPHLGCQRVRKSSGLFLFSAGAAFVAFLAGCETLGVRSADPVQTIVDPELGRKYQLYRPAGYDRMKDWPLVIVCNGGGGRMEAWQEQADTRGFIVAAPKLEGAGGKDHEKLKLNEQQILAVVQHVRAGHSVSEDRIFLHGYTNGAIPVLYTGLSHPDVFRGIAVTQPKFSATALGELAGRMDPHQPVYVHFNVIDRILGGDGRACVEWLHQNNVSAIVNPQGRAKGDDMRPSVDFFEETVRKTAWIHVRWFAPDPKKLNEIKFKLQSSFEPTAYLWEFGDGKDSPVAEPLHLYAVPGRYRVTVTATGPRGAVHKRSADVTVP